MENNNPNPAQQGAEEIKKDPVVDSAQQAGQDQGQQDPGNSSDAAQEQLDAAKAEAEKRPDFDINQPFLSEQEQSFINNNYREYDGYSSEFEMDEEDGGSELDDLRDDIASLKQSLSRSKQESDYEDEQDDPKVRAIEERLESLYERLEEQDTEREAEAYNQQLATIEAQNQYVLANYMKKKIEPTLKFLGIDDPQSVQAHYARQGITQELTTALAHYERTQLRGGIASPRKVVELVNAHFRNYVQRLNIRSNKNNQGNVSGMGQKQMTQDANAPQIQEIKREFEEISNRIEEIHQVPAYARYKYNEEVNQLRHRLAELDKRQRALQS